MTMQPSTLKMLEEANFSTSQALALSYAIEEELKGPQFVTVPILDVKLAELKLQISEVESRMTNKMMALGLSATGIIITATFFMVLNLRR